LWQERIESGKSGHDATRYEDQEAQTTETTETRSIVESSSNRRQIVVKSPVRRKISRFPRLLLEQHSSRSVQRLVKTSLLKSAKKIVDASQTRSKHQKHQKMTWFAVFCARFHPNVPLAQGVS
jgi:hypothetical protein